MKPLTFSLMLGSGVLLGGAGGWALRGMTPVAVPTSPVTEQVNALTKSERSKSAPTPSRRVEEERKKLRDTSKKFQAANYAEWEIAELKAMAAALLEEADPLDGLDGNKQGLLDRLILAMAAKDLEGTLAWVDENFPNRRGRFYGVVCEELKKGATGKEKLEFLKSHNLDPKSVGDMAGRYLYTEEGKTLDSETALYLLKHINPQKGGSSGGPCTFAPGFDFAGFAAATLEKMKADGSPPADYPLNFMEEWAKASPQAAIDFFFANCTGANRNRALPFSGLDQLLNGVKTSVPTEEYTAWLGQVLVQQSQTENPDRSTLTRLIDYGLSDPVTLGTSLHAIPDSAVKTKILQDALQTLTEASANPGGEIKLRGMLSLYQEPTARLTGAGDLVRNLKQRNGDPHVPRMIDTLTQQLANLGHSEADVQKVRDAK